MAAEDLYYTRWRGFPSRNVRTQQYSHYLWNMDLGLFQSSSSGTQIMMGGSGRLLRPDRVLLGTSIPSLRQQGLLDESAK